MSSRAIWTIFVLSIVVTVIWAGTVLGAAAYLAWELL